VSQRGSGISAVGGKGRTSFFERRKWGVLNEKKGENHNVESQGREKEGFQKDKMKTRGGEGQNRLSQKKKKKERKSTFTERGREWIFTRYFEQGY